MCIRDRLYSHVVRNSLLDYLHSYLDKEKVFYLLDIVYEHLFSEPLPIVKTAIYRSKEGGWVCQFNCSVIGNWKLYLFICNLAFFEQEIQELLYFCIKYVTVESCLLYTSYRWRHRGSGNGRSLSRYL